MLGWYVRGGRWRSLATHKRMPRTSSRREPINAGYGKALSSPRGTGAPRPEDCRARRVVGSAHRTSGVTRARFVGVRHLCRRGVRQTGGRGVRQTRGTIPSKNPSKSFVASSRCACIIPFRSNCLVLGVWRVRKAAFEEESQGHPPRRGPCGSSGMSSRGEIAHEVAS